MASRISSAAFKARCSLRFSFSGGGCVVAVQVSRAACAILGVSSFVPFSCCHDWYALDLTTVTITFVVLVVP